MLPKIPMQLISQIQPIGTPIGIYVAAIQQFIAGADAALLHNIVHRLIRVWVPESLLAQGCFLRTDYLNILGQATPGIQKERREVLVNQLVNNAPCRGLEWARHDA